MHRLKNILTEHEPLKHLVDVAVIPAGVGVGIAHYMELVNGLLTFFVLVTSFIWGVLRIMEMLERRQERKDSKRVNKDD